MIPDRSVDSRQVYVLLDPRPIKKVYVGVSVNPQRRYKQHLKDAHDTKKTCWFTELEMLGLKPLLKILEYNVGFFLAFDREQHYIDTLESEGYEIMNEVRYTER